MEKNCPITQHLINNPNSSIGRLGISLGPLWQSLQPGPKYHLRFYCAENEPCVQLVQRQLPLFFTTEASEIDSMVPHGGGVGCGSIDEDLFHNFVGKIGLERKKKAWFILLSVISPKVLWIVKIHKTLFYFRKNISCLKEQNFSSDNNVSFMNTMKIPWAKNKGVWLWDWVAHSLELSLICSIWEQEANLGKKRETLICWTGAYWPSIVVNILWVCSQNRFY